MISRRLISSASWIVRGLCTLAEESSTLSPSAYAARAKSSLGRVAYKRLLALGATKGSVSQVLNQCIMEGNPASKHELTCCIKELRRFKRHQHALEIMEWMERRKLNFSYGDYAIHLDLIAKTKGIEAAENYFSGLCPSTRNQATYGALLNCYCKEKMIDKALTHFQKMEELELVSYALPFDNLMGLYISVGEPQKVPILINEMKQRNIPLGSITYCMWMQSYASLNDIDGVEKVLNELAKDSDEKCTWNMYSTIAGIYVKAGVFEKAEVALKRLEEKMNHRSRAPYNYLISLYASTSNLNEVKRVWTDLKRNHPAVNNTSYLNMLRALYKLKDFEGLEKCFMEWKSSCSIYDMRLAYVAIRSYLEHDMYSEATMVFDEAITKSSGPFSKVRELFMVYFLKNRQVDSVIKHLRASLSEEKDDTRVFTPQVLSEFFKYFENEKDVDGSLEFCKILKKYDRLDSDAYRSLLKTYLSAGKSAPDDMRHRLEEDGIEIDEEIENLLAKVNSL